MIKDIINFENYKISDDGRVWSKKNNKWLKPIDVNGYKKASLYKNGKEYQRLVHRLVAEAFIPNPNNYEEINHINEDKSDNRVENLEWCTSSYNINYGTRIERQVNSISKKVFQYSIDNVLLNTYKSCTEAERENPSFNHRGISYACIGKLKTYKGFKWSHSLL